MYLYTETSNALPSPIKYCKNFTRKLIFDSSSTIEIAVDFYKSPNTKRILNVMRKGAPRPPFAKKRMSFIEIRQNT